MMEDLITELKELIKERVNTIYDLKYISSIRDRYLEDPVATVNSSIVYSRGISESLKNYKEIFTTPNNIELGKEEGLKILNTSLLDKFKELTLVENKYKEVFNKIIKEVTDKKESFVNSNRADSYVGIIDKAVKYLPYKEVLNKRVSSKLQVITSRDNIRTTNGKDWLYGISKDLEEENLNGLIEDIDISKENEYLNSETEGTPANVDITSVVIPNGMNYKTIANLSRAMDTDIDLTSLLFYIHKSVVTDKNILATSLQFKELNYKINSEAQYEDISEKLTNDPSSKLSIDSEVQVTSHDYLKVKVVTFELTNKLVNLYNEINKLTDIEELLVELTIKD